MDGIPRCSAASDTPWIARGDTATALQSYARVVADPGTPPALRDSIRAIVPHDRHENWETLVKNATQEMRQSVLQRAAPRSLSGPLRLMARSGETRRLGDVVNDKVTVVMFCGRQMALTADSGEIPKLPPFARFGQ